MNEALGNLYSLPKAITSFEATSPSSYENKFIHIDF